MPLNLSFGEEINLNSCIWFDENTERRNSFAAIIAGLLFFVGWWLMIDANTVYPEHVSAAYHVCGVIGTISFFMVNSVSQAQIRDVYAGGICNTGGARIWLFIGFVLGFASVIASCWIFFAAFIGYSDGAWAGVALVLQNVLIFVSSLMYKFGRIEETW